MTPERGPADGKQAYAAGHQGQGYGRPLSGGGVYGSPVDGAEDRSPPPGQVAVVMAALMLGLLLMGIQLWLLTVALELFLGGQGRQVWLLAVVSGVIFLGGIFVLKVLGRRPRLAR